MSDAPERIWIETSHIPDNVALDNWATEPDADEAHLFSEYIRADLHASTQAKLDKAMEALRFYACDSNWTVQLGRLHNSNAVNDGGDIATRTLAELEGK